MGVVIDLAARDECFEIGCELFRLKTGHKTRQIVRVGPDVASGAAPLLSALDLSAIRLV